MLLLLRPRKTAFSALHLLLFGLALVLLSFSIFLLFSPVWFLVLLHLLLFRLFSAFLLFWQLFCCCILQAEKNPLLCEKPAIKSAQPPLFHSIFTLNNSPQTLELYYLPDAAASLLFISFRWLIAAEISDF